jgi:hypothetical protein
MGTDWDFVPYDMYMYGGGGIGGWATLCGIANGCPALCNLIGLHGALGSDILGHYAISEWPSTSKLPDLYYDDNGYGPTHYPSEWAVAKTPMSRDDVLANVIPYSPLCHVSISKWCYAAGVNLGTMGTEGFQHKNDRCGKIAAEMAGYTAELINHYALNGVSADPYSMPAATADCSTCHTKTADVSLYPAQVGKMDCAECHVDNTIHAAKNLIVEGVWTADGSGTPKNTFTSGDAIQYHVRFTILGAGACYVKTARAKVKDSAPTKMLALNKDEQLMAATYDWMWSDTIDPTDALGVAKVIMRLKMFDYQGGDLLDLQETKHKFTIV